MKRPKRRGRIVTIVVLALSATVAFACSSSSASSPYGADPAVAADVRKLAAEMERIHPNLFHSVSKAEFAVAVDALVARLPELGRDQILVELMRIVAMTGERDGHMGLFPLATSHARTLHQLPIRLWAFPEGLHVIAAPGRPELVGSRLVAVEDTPADRLVARLLPLITRDNDWDRLGRVPAWAVTTEVLHGLGVTPDPASARLTLERPGGERLEVRLEAIETAAYHRAVGELWAPNPPPGIPVPLWLRNRSKPMWVATLNRGTVVYAVYSSTQAAWTLGEQIVRRARSRKVRRVILDVRLNGGGDNTTYGSLLVALRHPAVNRRGRLVLLTSRLTFSAAGNFAAEVDASTRARIVGEPAGGSPHNYGDNVAVELPALGWTVYVPPEYVEVLGRADQRSALRPDVEVELPAAAFFAGRDPVLDRAIALR